MNYTAASSSARLHLLHISTPLLQRKRARPTTPPCWLGDMSRQLVWRSRNDGSGILDQFEKEMVVALHTEKPNVVSCQEKWQQTVTVLSGGEESNKISIRSTISEIRARLDGVVLHIEVGHRFHQHNNTGEDPDDSHVDHTFTTSADINLRLHFDSTQVGSQQPPLTGDTRILSNQHVKSEASVPVPTMPKAMKQQQQQAWRHPATVQTHYYPAHQQYRCQPVAVPHQPKATQQQEQHSLPAHQTRYCVSPFTELSQSPSPGPIQVQYRDSQRNHDPDANTATLDNYYAPITSTPSPGPYVRPGSKAAGKRPVLYA